MAKQKELNHFHVGFLAVASIFLSVVFFAQTLNLSYSKNEDKGFDQYGYNYNARLFNGLADGVDRVAGDKILGGTTFSQK